MNELVEIKHYEITKYNILNLYSLKKNNATQLFVNQLKNILKTSVPNLYSFKYTALLKAIKFSFLFMDVIINSSDREHVQGVLHTVQEGVKYILIKGLAKTPNLVLNVSNEGLKLKVELIYKEEMNFIFYIVYSGELA